MKLHEALRKIVRQFGVNVLQEQRLMSLLSDYQAFDDFPAMKAVMKSIADEGHGKELCRLSIDGSDSECLRYADDIKKSLIRNSRFRNEFAGYAADSLSFALGLCSLVHEPSDHGYEPFAKSEEVVSEEEPNQCRKDGMRDSGEDTLDQICRLRRSFDELQCRHSDDSAFALSVRSALDAADFPSEEQLRKEFAKGAGSERLLRIGIVGALKAGRSSLISTLFFDGKDMLPKAAAPMTAALTEITYGDECSVTVDFFTDQDIAELKEKSDEYERRFNEIKTRKTGDLEKVWRRTQDGLKYGLKADWDSARADLEKLLGLNGNFYRKSFTAIGEPGASERNEWESKAERAARIELRQNLYLSGAYDQYQMIRKASPNQKKGCETLSVGSVAEIAGRLQDYVSSDGRYMPFASRISITLPLESLRGISLVEIPGFNDPVPSRDERARLALLECDAVFILSRATPFLTKSDMEVISKITQKNGLHEIYIVPSQADSTLVTPEIVSDSNGDLDAAIDKVARVLNGVVAKNLGGINENGVFDQLISGSSDRMFLTSGICGAMAKTFSGRESWDAGKKSVWRNLCEAYPGFFTDSDEKKSIASLEKLANTDRIRECIEDVKARKAEIFRVCLEQFGSKYAGAARDARDSILRDIKAREDEIKSNDLSRTEKEIKLLQESYNSLAPEIDDVFLDTVSSWFDAVVSDCQDKLSDLSQVLNSEIKRQQGTGTRYGTRKGPHWWSPDEPYRLEVTTVNTYGVKNAIADCIESYNDSLPHYFNDQVRVLVRQVTNNVQKVWSESTADSYGSASDFRNRVRAGIQSVLDNEYNLEYRGPKFTCGGDETILAGQAADEFVCDARVFVSGLIRRLKSMMRDAADDVYSKCMSSHFPKIVLDPYLQQLEDRLKYREHPELFLKKLSQIEEEVSKIDLP